MLRLFNAVTTNGNSINFTPRGVADPQGFNIEVHTSGGFGGGNVTVMQSPDGGTTWSQVGSPITTVGRTVVTVYSQVLLRLVLAGATAATLTAWASNVQ